MKKYIIRDNYLWRLVCQEQRDTFYKQLMKNKNKLTEKQLVELADSLIFEVAKDDLLIIFIKDNARQVFTYNKEVNNNFIERNINNIKTNVSMAEKHESVIYTHKFFDPKKAGIL